MIHTKITIVTVDRLHAYERKGEHLAIFARIESAPQQRVSILLDLLISKSPCLVGFSGDDSEILHDKFDDEIIDKNLPYAITAFFHDGLENDWLEFNDINCESGTIDEIIFVPVGDGPEADDIMRGDFEKLFQ